jgi:predicted  nucleic acid-binding Zn-ribbon protein
LHNSEVDEQTRYIATLRSTAAQTKSKIEQLDAELQKQRTQLAATEAKLTEAVEVGATLAKIDVRWHRITVRERASRLTALPRRFVGVERQCFP